MGVTNADAPRLTRLRDVAELAGVSFKTVSNVVNGYQHVTEKTRLRVQQAIDELDYRPNLSARALRGGHSGVIALAVPELTIPYFAELASSVIRAAEKQSWTVLIDQTDGVRAREQSVVSGIRGQQIDGLIYSPIALSAAELAGYAGRTPVVLLGEQVHGGSMDHVAVDNVGAAEEATLHLASIGRRRIGAIGYQGAGAGESARLRAEGYESAMAKCGLKAPARFRQQTPHWHRADGTAAMTRMLIGGKPPDAVFCFNDLLALGAIRCLLQRGLRVPDDVAVIGFDDIEEGRFSTPSLTTIQPDKEEIGQVAVDYLKNRLAARTDIPAREHVAAHTLVVRESTGG